MTTTDFFTYLLRDPRIANRRDGIFYVGKGRGNRSSEHEIEAARTQISAAQNTSERAHKLRILDELAESGLNPEIEIIAYSTFEGLTESDAFLVEAALIAALELKGSGNLVEGHGLRLLPHEAFNIAKDSGERVLPQDTRFVIVPVSNIWGGANLLGNLHGAGDPAVFENARHHWSALAEWRVSSIASAAGSDAPVVLLAVDSHPSDGNKCIVVGVFELSEAYLTGFTKGDYFKKDGSRVEPHPAWGFKRVEMVEERESVTTLREHLVGHAPMKSGSKALGKPQDRRYFNW